MVILVKDLTFLNTTYTTRSGIVKYKNLSLSLPIKYRHLISNKTPLYLLVGLNPYFSLINNAKWNFDEFEYDSTTDTYMLEKRNQKEKK